MYQALPLLAAAAFPGLPPEEAERRLGATVPVAFLASPGGAAMAAYFRQLGTRNALLDAQDLLPRREQLPPGPFAQRRASGRCGSTSPGPGGHAHLFCGIVEAAHHHSGEPGLRAAVEEQGPDHATLRVTW